MVLAIEPMVNVGRYNVRILDDNWTTVTEDGKLSAHYENTVAITDGDPDNDAGHLRKCCLVMDFDL